MTTRTPSRTTVPALALALALAGGLAGCSSDGGDDTATDPDAASSTPSPTESASSSTPSQTPSETPGQSPGDAGTVETIDVMGSAGVTQASLVHATDVGGSASTLAFVLDTDQAVDDFVGQFDPAFAAPLGAAIAAEAGLAPEATPYGATVNVGCDAPRAVAIEAGEAGLEVVPRLPKSNVQCLAPMTYVVVFTAPDA